MFSVVYGFVFQKQRREETELQQQCYKIDLDFTRQQLMEDYLDTARKSPPSFLLPQHEYHQRIKRKCGDTRAEAVIESMNHDNVNEPRVPFDVQVFLTKVQSFSSLKEC